MEMYILKPFVCLDISLFIKQSKIVSQQNRLKQEFTYEIITAAFLVWLSIDQNISF